LPPRRLDVDDTAMAMIKLAYNWINGHLAAASRFLDVTFKNESLGSSFLKISAFRSVSHPIPAIKMRFTKVLIYKISILSLFSSLLPKYKNIFHIFFMF
jgi:hypothetical protein